VPDNGCDVVVVGASAGGVEALTKFARALPADFPAPILVVLHIAPTGESYLPHILSRSGNLRAVHPFNGDELQPGCIYVAPPDQHLLLNGNTIELTRGPRENGHRPAIDPLFRSAVASFDGRVAGVVLSGSLDDGTVGLHAIKEAGGAALVQDPDEALYPSMPMNAIAYAEPDYVQTVEDIVDTLVRLTTTAHDRNGKEAPMPSPAPNPSAEKAQPGNLAPFSCPDCGGTLWETRAGGVWSYRCRVGHAYTMNSLAARQAESLERILWSAYRALEERAGMSRRVARRLAERGRVQSAGRFERQAEISARQAERLKELLDALEPAPDLADEAAAQAAG
jgi:two-component system chemotaxis response regulator CheB